MEPVKSAAGYIICITNLNEETTEEEIVDLFMEYGDVKEIQVNQDRISGLGKGYALLVMNKQSEAEAAIEGLNGKEYGGKKL